MKHSVSVMIRHLKTDVTGNGMLVGGVEIEFIVHESIRQSGFE